MRKLNILDTNYNNSGLHARIPALNNLTLLEFFEDNNLLDYHDKAIYDGLVETTDEAIAIGDKAITLFSDKKYFSGFDIIFETLPNTLPDSYRLWLVNQGVTDQINHSFVSGNNVMLGDIKSPTSNIGPNNLYLNLFNLNVGDTLKIKATHFNLIDITDYELTDEDIYYYYRMYRYLKDNTQKTGYTYFPKGQSKYDVAYVNKTIDDPIAELNGHTLREVFEDGNKITNPYLNIDENLNDIGDGYSAYNSSLVGNLSVNEGQYFTVLGSNGGIGFNTNILNGHTYYIKLRLKSSDVIQWYGYYYSFNIYTNNVLTEVSHIRNETNDNSGTYLGIRKLSGYTEPFDVFWDRFFFIDLTVLGISGLTQEQMDYYYSLYQSRKNITKKVLTYADIFEWLNLIINSEFNNDITGWTFNNAAGSVVDGVFSFSATSQFGGIRQSVSYEKNDKLYIISKIKSTSPSLRLFISNAVENQVYHSGSGSYEVLSFVFTSGAVVTPLIRIEDFAPSNWEQNNIDYVFSINIKHFDESITKEQLDTMLARYLLVKNIVIYPEIYVPTEPIGLGNRFKLLSVDDNIYGHELDFEDISFKMYFGVNYDAYKGYNDLMNMLKNNKAVIEYDWGIGPRLNDVRLIHAPKTEKNTSMVIISKFIFKRLNPFYELIIVAANEDMKNSSDLESPINLDLTVNNTAVSIKLLDTSSGVQRWISFDFTGVSTPFNLTINPETKKLLIDGMTDAYDYVDHTKDSFIYLPGDNEVYTLNITGAAVNKITYKKWVIS